MLWPGSAKPLSHKVSPLACRRVTGCQFTSYNGLHTHADKMPGYARCVDASFQRATQRALRAADGAAAGRRTAATMMPVGVPRVPYKGKFRTWQWVDIWNCLYRDRIIFMSDALNDELGNQLVATMLYLDSENKKDISIYMNVEGGEVVPSLAMHDTFKHIKSDVATIGFGGVMGMAGFLLACGALLRPFAVLQLACVARTYASLGGCAARGSVSLRGSHAGFCVQANRASATRYRTRASCCTTRPARRRARQTTCTTRDASCCGCVITWTPRSLWPQGARSTRYRTTSSARCTCRRGTRSTTASSTRC